MITRDTDRKQALSRFLIGLCLVTSLLSLALSAFLIYSLLHVRQTVVEGLDAAIEAPHSLSQQGLRYEYPFNQETPVSADIPFRQELDFPFAGTVPIYTTFEVPISTSVEVNTSVPIRIEESFHIETSIAVSTTIPIDFEPDDPGMQNATHPDPGVA